MHDPVIQNLEEILRGGASAPAAEAHLKQCPPCRAEVAAMTAQRQMFRALRAPESAEPAAGFYARVMNRIEVEARPSIWSLFGESVFSRRLAYASMTFFVLLGTIFVSTQTQEPLIPSAPETILAGDDTQTVRNNTESDREAVLVHLASYED